MVAGDFRKGEGGGDFEKGDSFGDMRKLLAEKKKEKTEAEIQKAEAERKQFIEASNLFYSNIGQFLEMFYSQSSGRYGGRYANTVRTKVKTRGLDQTLGRIQVRDSPSFGLRDLQKKFHNIVFIELLKECQKKFELDGFEFEWKEEIDNRHMFPSYLHMSWTPQVKTDEVPPYKHRFGFDTGAYLRWIREQENKARERENKARERLRDLEIVANEFLELGPLPLLLDEKAAKKMGYEPEIFLDLDCREMLKSKYRSVNQTIIRAIRNGSSGVNWDYGRTIEFPSGLNKNQVYPRKNLEDEGFTIREVLEKCAEILCENGFQASAYTKPNPYVSGKYHHGIQITINYD